MHTPIFSWHCYIKIRSGHDHTTSNKNPATPNVTFTAKVIVFLDTINSLAISTRMGIANRRTHATTGIDTSKRVTGGKVAPISLNIDRNLGRTRVRIVFCKVKLTPFGVEL